MNTWGNGGHEPGGDPSWLGGNDRGSGLPGRGDGVQGDFPESRLGDASGFSSDFSSGFSGGGPAPSPDFTTSGDARRQASSADEMGPQFGTARKRAEPLPESPTWKSEFMEQTGLGRGRRGRSVLQIVIGVAAPTIVLIMVFSIFLRSGTNFPWFILVFMFFPVLTRVGRIIRRNLKD